MRSGLKSGRVVAILTAAAATAAVAVGMPDSATAAERFYQIMSATGKCVDIAGGSSEEGAQIVQNACTGTPSQSFVFVPHAFNAYQPVETFADKCWDVPGGSVEDGLVQWSCGNNQENQKFRFVAGTASYYEITTQLGDRCLTMPGTQDGARMEWQPCDGRAQQQFLIA